MKTRILIFICALFMSRAVTCADAVTYEDTLRKIAKATVRFMKSRNVKVITPQYTGRADFPGGGEAGFTESLREKLANEGMKVSRNAKYILSARAFNSQKSANDLAISIRCQFLDEFGNVLQTLAADGTVTDGADVAKLVGINTVFQPTTDGLRRLEDLSRARKKKTLYLHAPGKLYSDYKGRFAIEVLVNGRPTVVTEGTGDDEGLAFTSMSLGQIYKVRLYNRAAYRVAVDLRVDGISSFQFYDKDKRTFNGGPRFHVIKPNGSVDVAGWQLRPGMNEQFVTSTIANSAVAEAGLPLDKVGLITATFHALWQPPEQLPPRDEPSYQFFREQQMFANQPRNIQGAPGPSYGNGLGTGRGKQQVQNSVVIEAETGVPRATISVRYRRKK